MLMLIALAHPAHVIFTLLQLPKWYSHESPVKHPLPQTIAASEERFRGQPASLTDHESFESILAMAKAQESGSMGSLPEVPEVPAPLLPSVTIEGLGTFTLQDAAEAAPPQEDELGETQPLLPDEFLEFIQEHGWVRKDQLEEMRQTKQQATQRLKDIHSGADGMSLANHAANAGSIAGGASSPAMRASLQRAAAQGPQSPLRMKPGTSLAVVDTPAPGGSSAASLRAEQDTLPTHRPLSSLLVASVVGLATTTHIPLTAPPRVPHQAGEMLNALADKPNASELDAWLAVQTWALQCTQEELLSVRRKLVAAYREATPEGVTFETGERVTVEQLHAAATTAADDAVTAWQLGPKLPEVGMNETASTILAGHKFVHELLASRTAAGTGELQAVLDRYKQLMPELMARVQVKNEQHDKLQSETQDIARAVAQLRSAALAAGVPHPHDVASGRSGGKKSDPRSASPLALRNEDETSPRKAYERAAADVTAQYVSATRRAKESTDGSAIVQAAKAARLTDGREDKDSNEMQLEALATMLETLGPDGAQAAKEREMQTATAAARAAVQAQYKPRVELQEHEGQNALDDLAIGAIAKKQSLESDARDMARQAYAAKRQALDANINALQVHAAELKHAIQRVESTAAGALELTVLKARVRQIWADVGLDMALPEVLERHASSVRQPSYLSPLPAPARNAVDAAVLAVARGRGPQHEAAILRAEASETGDASFQSFAGHVNSFLSAALLACCARPDLAGGIGAPSGGEGAQHGPAEHIATPLSFKYDSLLHDALAATKRRMTVSASKVEWQSLAAADKALVVQQPGAHASSDAVMEKFHVRWPSRQLDVGDRHKGVAGHTVSLLLTARDAPLSTALGSPRRAPLETGASAAAHTSTAKDGSTAAALQSLDGSAPADAVPAEWDGEHLRYFQRTWQSESWAALAKTFANSATYRTLLEVAGDSSTLHRSGAVVPRAKFGLGDTGGSQPGLQHIHDAYAYDLHRQRMLAHWK